MSKKILGPVSRVEGDLEITLETDQGLITSSRIKGTLYRGFEDMMLGRHQEDSLVLTPRICGICSISQSVAAARALASLNDIEVADNGQRVINILHATEVAADILTHFYLFFMPDFAHAAYGQKDWFRQASDRFAPQKGESYLKALKIRARFLHIAGMLGGKWPHTLAIQPGGSTRALNLTDQIKLTNIIAEFRQFLTESLFGCSPEAVAGMTHPDEISETLGQNSDLGFFWTLAQELGLEHIGRHHGSYLSYGGYPDEAGNNQLRAGVFKQKLQPFNVNDITESVAHSFFQGSDTQPLNADHFPEPLKHDAYSWAKAPRLNQQIAEVGAYARALASAKGMAREWHSLSGSAHVSSRIMARMQELAWLVIQMDVWLKELQSGQSYINNQPLKQSGTGIGLTEAARGSLGHWLKVEGGRIEAYQIIAPTTWNFSPRDQNDQPGVLEAALSGLHAEKQERAIAHSIRSFDPCMQCTVH